MERKMFYKTNPLVFARAKELRNNVTEAEMILWGYLRTKPFGHKFRRQHPLLNYIVDFFCYKLKLIIEVDGSVHNNEEVKRNDEERQRLIESEGLNVLRFTNAEVIKQPEIVLKKIQLVLQNNLQIKEGLTPPLGGWGV